MGDAIPLEHIDPAAWFDTPFVPFGRINPAERPVPELLAAGEGGPVADHTITFRVDDAERDELIARAARERSTSPTTSV